MPTFDDVLRPKDRIGRQQLHRMRFANILEAMPWMIRAFTKEVPPEHIAWGDGEATISCHCGERPLVKLGDIKSCECGRFFLHAGRTILVALSPKA